MTVVELLCLLVQVLWNTIEVWSGRIMTTSFSVFWERVLVLLVQKMRVLERRVVVKCIGSLVGRAKILTGQTALKVPTV
jgi:hypothetical protein